MCGFWERRPRSANKIMTKYNIYPNFKFQVEADNQVEANAEAYDLLCDMRKGVWFDFDFETEEEQE